jgi:hypothetical protein
MSDIHIAQSHDPSTTCVVQRQWVAIIGIPSQAKRPEDLTPIKIALVQKPLAFPVPPCLVLKHIGPLKITGGEDDLEAMDRLPRPATPRSLQVALMEQLLPSSAVPRILQNTHLLGVALE